MPLFGRQSQKLPYLNEYVGRMAARTPEGQAAHAAGCSLAILMSGVGFFLLERIIPLAFAGFIALFILLPLLASLAAIWVKQLSRPPTEREQRRKEAQDAILFMNSAVQRGRLHRKIDRACGLLLDECARNWLRIQNTFQSSFWQDKDLSAHWRAARDQSLAASNQAMDDVIVMLMPVLEARNQQSGAQEVIGEMLEAFLNVDTSGPIQPLPRGFHPAMELAQKLKELADEVEDTASRATAENAFKEHYSAKTHIDQVLGDLRMIREAESELQQELKPGDER